MTRSRILQQVAVPGVVAATDHGASARPDHAITSAGYDTRSPLWNVQGYFKITNAPGILSELTTDPGGHVTWEWRAADPARVTPAQLTGAVLALLHPAAPQAAVEQRADLAPVSLAGRALRASGLDVTLGRARRQPDRLHHLLRTLHHQPSSARARRR